MEAKQRLNSNAMQQYCRSSRSSSGSGSSSTGLQTKSAANASNSRSNKNERPELPESNGGSKSGVRARLRRLADGIKFEWRRDLPA